MAGLLDFLGFGGGGEGPGLLGNLQTAFGSPEMDRIKMALMSLSGNEHAQKALAEAPQRRQQVEGYKAMLPAIMQNPDIDPAIKAAVQRNPAMLGKLFENMSKPNEAKPHNIGDVVGAWNPRGGGRFSPQFVAPKVISRGPEETIEAVTPGLAGVPSAASRARPVPGSLYQGSPYGGSPAENQNLAPAGLPPPAGPQENFAPSRQILAAPPAPVNPYAMPGKPTDEQTKSSLYATRMFQAERILRDPKVTGAATSLTQRGLGAVPVAGNFMVSESYQHFDQAQRDFLNAVLRRESGAVISESEFNNGRKQYFPQPGDSPAQLAQKQRNRMEAIKGVATGAGPNYQPPLTIRGDGSLAPIDAPPPNSSPSMRGAGPKATQENVASSPVPPELRAKSIRDQLQAAPEGSQVRINGILHEKRGGKIVRVQE